MHTFSRSERHPASFAIFVLVVASLATLAVGSATAGACLMLAGLGLLAATKPARTPDWKSLLNRALESTPAGLCIFDANQRVIISNGHFAAIYGLTKSCIRPGMTLREVLERRIDLVSCPLPTQYIDDYIREVPSGTVDRFHDLSDGRIISVSRHPMSGGGIVEVHKDVTAERRAEDRADQAMRALVDRQYAIDQAVIVAITDARGTITYANDNFCKISGYSREELIGQNHRLLKSGVHPQELFRGMHRCLASGRVWRGELCNRSKSGKLYWVDTVITPQLGPDGKPVSYMAIRIDITARKKAEAQISFAATHDSLTRLLNRSALLEQAAQGSEQSSRFSVHLLDLDGFKDVNDTLGHDAGDHLLKQVASRLHALAGPQDLVARLGGDEFAIIRRDRPDRESSLQFSSRLVAAMTKAFEFDNRHIHISTSVGIALCPEHGSDPEELLKKADLALYATKAAGKNGFRLYQPAMLEAIEGEKELEAELRHAVGRNEFELHYQPILDTGTRTIRAAEALVRWRHPIRGLIGPARFIPVAERTGLILPLSEWIIQQACRDAASWPAATRLAINVSAIQFKRGNLFEVVMQALVRSGLDPERLEIEVTETALLENQSEQLQTFRRLKSIGVALVLDDFGTGYSSASYLTSFPFDKIKIDRTFVQGLDRRRECAAVVASAIALARGLGITTTAEGIESEAQFQAMRAMGIDFAQGYLFSPPVPLDEFISEQRGESVSSVA
jgi:diguanylate cyclase (GGDEF)-like protein/PAS domain S-box-containing protein